MKIRLSTSSIDQFVEVVNSCREAIEHEEDPDELMQIFEELAQAGRDLSGVASAEHERLSSILDAIA